MECMQEKLKGNTIPQDLIKALSNFINIRIAKNNNAVERKETQLKATLSLLCDLISSIHIVEQKEEDKSYYLVEYNSKIMQIIREQIKI